MEVEVLPGLVSHIPSPISHLPSAVCLVTLYITYTPLGPFRISSTCVHVCLCETKVTLMRQKWFGLPRLGLVVLVCLGSTCRLPVNAFVFAFCIIYKLNANSQVGKQSQEDAEYAGGDSRPDFIVANNWQHYRCWLVVFSAWNNRKPSSQNAKWGKKSILTDSIYDRWFGFRLLHSFFCTSASCLFIKLNNAVG